MKGERKATSLLGKLFQQSMGQEFSGKEPDITQQSWTQKAYSGQSEIL